MSSDDDDEHSNDDKRSEERSYGNIDITGVTHDTCNIEQEVISNRSPKRKNNNDSSESDEEEVKSKKSRCTDSSSTDVLPRSSSRKEFDDETIASSIAEENSYETEDAMEGANVDIASFIAGESIHENYNVERDVVEYTCESQDNIQVTSQADVHWAYSDEANEPNVNMPSPANVHDEMGDEMDDDSGDDSANESVQDPETAEEEIEESLENNAGKILSKLYL